MTVLIVDLSNNNARVAFDVLAQTPRIAGVWLKATEGATFVDGTWAARSRAARAAGLRVGAYHFAQPGAGDAAREAERFASVVGRVQRRDLRPVLDLEQHGTLAPYQLDAWARAWMRRVRELLGVGAIFYSYPAFIEAMRPARPIGYGLWLASWSRNDGSEHPYRVPAPWRRAVAHQYASRAIVAGVDGRCDLSSAASLRPLLAHPLRGSV